MEYSENFVRREDVLDYLRAKADASLPDSPAQAALASAWRHIASLRSVRIFDPAANADACETRYESFYNLVVSEIQELRVADVANDYRLCKALAALYELQDYLAGQIACVDPPDLEG